MDLPLFFEPYLTRETPWLLSQETSRHIVQVLRMKESQQFQLTNGKGESHVVEIMLANKKATEVKFISAVQRPALAPAISIGISLMKNPSRFEWFLEKATEIGVSEIFPLICARTEKPHFRYDRMRGIIVSAMLQSKQLWLPVLHEPIAYNQFVSSTSGAGKYIAHCLPGNIIPLRDKMEKGTDKVILIGPEGDFTSEEIDLAIAKDFIPVSLGSTRLRTETAGVVAATIFRLD